MSDYISRELAIEDFEQYNQENSTWTPQRVKTLLMRIPTADVKPVRHVTPICCGSDEYYGKWRLCPSCGFDLNAWGAKFCGGCGAKMDLEDESHENWQSN
mgnify:CR=1 FL=1